jgi:hypothetical protein
MGTTMSSQRAWRLPETRSGPAERIAFIDAHEIGPPNMASSSARRQSGSSGGSGGRTSAVA